MFNMGGPIKEGVMHGIREPYRHGRRVGYKEGGWGDYFKNIFQKSKPLAKQLVGGKFKPVVKAVDQISKQKWLNSLHPSRIKETVSGIGSTGAGQTFMQNLRSFPGVSKIPGWAKSAGQTMLKYPKTSIAGGLGLTSDPAISAYKAIGKQIPGVIKGVTPGWLERLFTK